MHLANQPYIFSPSSKESLLSPFQMLSGLPTIVYSVGYSVGDSFPNDDYGGLLDGQNTQT